MLNHDDILVPLALTVIIDNKVRDPELIEFRQQAGALFSLFELDDMDDAAIANWFKDREADIRQTICSKGKNTAILRALTRFKDDAHIEAMFDAMVCISISDKEYRREESELIKSAAAIWGFERPPIKIDD